MSFTVVITGGAAGIGAALAGHFGQKTNSRVFILDLNVESAKKTVDTLSAKYPNGCFYFKQCDVASWESQAAAFGEIYRDEGRIDVVVANAGVFEKTPIVAANQTEPKKPDVAVIDINVAGMIFTVSLATHYLAKNTAISPLAQTPLRGHIICTASNAGLYPFSTLPLYSASKHAIVGLVRSLGRPLASENLRIQINSIAPGPIQTSFSPNPEVYQNLFTTPFSTVTRAVDMFMEKTELTGVVAELQGEHITLSTPPPYAYSETGKNIEYYWSLGHI